MVVAETFTSAYAAFGIIKALNGLDKNFYNWLTRKDIFQVVGVRLVMQV